MKLTFNDDGLSGGGSKGNGVFVAAFGAESICLVHFPGEGSEGRQPQIQSGIHAESNLIPVAGGGLNKLNSQRVHLQVHSNADVQSVTNQKPRQLRFSFLLIVVNL